MESLFPVVWEPTSTEFDHKVREGEGRETIPVDQDPITDKVVLKAPEDTGDFDLIVNTTLCADEVI